MLGHAHTPQARRAISCAVAGAKKKSRRSLRACRSIWPWLFSVLPTEAMFCDFWGAAPTAPLRVSGAGKRRPDRSDILNSSFPFNVEREGELSELMLICLVSQMTLNGSQVRALVRPPRKKSFFPIASREGGREQNGSRATFFVVGLPCDFSFASSPHWIQRADPMVQVDYVLVVE